MSAVKLATRTGGWLAGKAQFLTGRREGPAKMLYLCASLALTLASVAFLLRGISWSEVAESLSAANFVYVIPALAALVATMVAKAWRWQVLLSSRYNLPVSRLLSPLLIGYMGNSVLPGRLGELVRAYTLAQKQGVNGVYALSSILVEKVLDSLTLVGFLVVLMPFVPLPSWARLSTLAAAVAFMGLLAVLVTLSVAKERVLQWASSVAPIRPFIGKIGPALDALEVLRNRKLAVRLVVGSVAVWLTGGLVNYFVLLAFPLPAGLDVALLVLVVTNLGLTVPSLPAGLGVFHALVVVALSTFGAGGEAALGYAFLLHLLVFGSFIVAGQACLWKESLSLVSLSKEAGLLKRAEGGAESL